MRSALFVCAIALAGCSSSSSTPPNLYSGEWLYQSSSTHGSTYTFNNDGTYTGGVLVATSATTANSYVEEGTFTTTATQITLTPTETSCPGISPVYTDDYAIKDGLLVLTSAGGTTTFDLNTEKPNANESVTDGCFGSGGTFTANPVAPVKNE